MTDSIFHVEARWGGSEKSPSLQRLIELIAELEVRDEEHPDTWMIHANSGWALRLDEDRFAYLEDPECGTVKHMADVSSERALKLWTAFAAGGPDAVADFDWEPGQRPVNELELAERAERARAAQLRSDREFYDQLGSQMSDATCRVEGCTQGRIQYSVLCKAHHFEQVRGRPCPFSE
jgi:hypothetical protein